MPSYWYNLRDLSIHDEDDEDTIANKEFNKRIAAYRKPYFMIYVYPTLKKEYKDYIKNTKSGMMARFQAKNIDELSALVETDDTNKIHSSVDYFRKRLPAGGNTCLINRICWLFEKEFSGFTHYISKIPEFDYNILKSGAKYTRDTYGQIKRCYQRHQERNSKLAKMANTDRVSTDYILCERLQIISAFQKECYQICTNAETLCDIALDMCYQSEGSKQFVWDICGSSIVNRLLARNDNTILYPVLVDDGGDFQFCGKQFKMMTKIIKEPIDDYTE